jgi:hypothetical protein
MTWSDKSGSCFPIRLASVNHRTVNMCSYSFQFSNLFESFHLSSLIYSDLENDFEEIGLYKLDQVWEDGLGRRNDQSLEDWVERRYEDTCKAVISSC